MIEVWQSGQAGENAPLRSLDLGAWDSTLAGVTLQARRLVQDSREAGADDVFVAIGTNASSALPYIDAALAQGAVAVLVDANAAESAHGDERVFAIANLRDVIGTRADAFVEHPSASMAMIGITGTNGKTSTAHLLTQAWQRLGMTSATIGTLGAGITGEPRINMGMTTPQVTSVHHFLDDFYRAGVTNVAMEVSSHALEQRRVDGVTFDIVAFTNFTRDHLDYHGSMEEYAVQKAKIFTLPGIQTALLNLDDAAAENHFHHTVPAGVRAIGMTSHGHAEASVRAENVQLTTEGLEFDLVIEGESHHVSSGLIGRFNVDNLLTCATVLWAQGIEPRAIAEVMAPLEPVLGRMTRIRENDQLPLVVVDAGHTPDAVRQAVTALRDSGHTRIVTVFGATGDRDPGKRPVMARIVEDASDVIVVTDDDVHNEDGDQIVDHIRAGFEHPERVVEIRDRATAIAYAIDAANPDDVVLLQGKGHEPYQIIGNERVPFSDIDTAIRLLKERAK
ncbi:UDP-N-acetylmuramoyl-L-alanyl-D-glutamate--2,6-diaminopimelate ligase [Salinibacterium sp. NK8237]|uniref:UDP-N-acetylmuramoyl-L-alanyl-D-glutamate--2, 6-diaminopimelate ligase n=1 Tax=Salinibacterium sp. NK8237 TaxID=2792038 RepID=UPI0018CEC296|nr:UDP-N-acetylmuramoyl-L-alanyl-D-glutamate--2,6-diaminopimelate ligase [Salinibacterium sp. NK8237]MBH0130990.1 UDP-N-acetylmuramoyl-L-alanyl-D-glutamate--2,6-diaminopimelate ligase [Salinibacterium sp. NK8237]